MENFFKALHPWKIYFWNSSENDEKKTYFN